MNLFLFLSETLAFAGGQDLAEAEKWYLAARTNSQNGSTTP